MNKLWKFITTAALAFPFAFSAVAFSGCATEEPGNTDEPYVECEEDLVVPISIQDDFAADKVVTEGFEIERVREDTSVFTLPKLVADNMLLQANVTTRLWGQTSLTGSVAAQVLDKDGNVETTCYGTAKDGQFLIYLAKHEYGTGYSLRIVAEDGKCVTLKNVAFGELWIGGGQSNMGWTMSQCYNGKVTKLLYQKIIDNSANSDIRLFHVYNNQSQTTVDEVGAATGWLEARPSTVRDFSAAAYFFARELNAQYDIPVGVIMSCVGGTGIHTWMPEGVLSDAVGTSSPNAGYTDSSYFNGMIYPLRNEVVRGVLWYQGEGDHNKYDVNYGLLMKGWREAFGKNNMWFTTVTLPRYTDAESYYLCREQQMAASIKDPYATYSVNIDCGLLPKDVAEGDDLNGPPTVGIHPYDKQPIGERAAHVTMQDLYGAKGVWSGPKFKSARVSGNRVIITFTNVGKGLAMQGKAGFEIAGENGVFETATVRIVAKNRIELSSANIANPVQVIYGRSNEDLDVIESFAECVCLYNTKGEDEHVAYPAEQFSWKKG